MIEANIGKYKTSANQEYDNAKNDTHQSGVLPSVVSALVEAPLTTRCFTTSKWPAFAAQWSGVHPFYIQKAF